MKPFASTDKAVILVVDPALSIPESEAYNNLEHIISQLRKWRGCEDLSLRFWLPALDPMLSLSRILESIETQGSYLAGCISLGSFAHLHERDAYPWFDDFERLLEHELAPRQLDSFFVLNLRH